MVLNMVPVDAGTSVGGTALEPWLTATEAAFVAAVEDAWVADVPTCVPVATPTADGSSAYWGPLTVAAPLADNTDLRTFVGEDPLYGWRAVLPTTVNTAACVP